MAATQARAERQISELLKRPGNDICADCSSPSPRWCSWNLGIFLCVSCASVHRKLGSHVSRVKSLTLDTFTREQIDSLSKVGNTKGNAERNNDDRMNPPPTNLEMEGRDNELERYIRKKYTAPRPMPAASNLLSARAPPSLQAARDNIPLRRSPTPGAGPRSPAPPSQQQQQQQARPSSTTPVFGNVLEHRPAAEGMRRGRPTPSTIAGPVGSFQPPAHAAPPSPRAPTQSAPTQGGYNPSMGFATAIQAAQFQPAAPQVPTHGPWGDLLSLTQPPAQQQQQQFQQPQQFLAAQPTTAFAPSSYTSNGSSIGTPSLPAFGQQHPQPQPHQAFQPQPTGYPSSSAYGQPSSFQPPAFGQQQAPQGMFTGQQQPMQTGFGMPQPQQQAYGAFNQSFQPQAFPQQQQQQQSFGQQPQFTQQAYQPQQEQQQPQQAGAQSFMQGMMPARQVGLPNSGGGW